MDCFLQVMEQNVFHAWMIVFVVLLKQTALSATNQQTLMENASKHQQHHKQMMDLFHVEMVSFSQTTHALHAMCLTMIVINVMQMVAFHAGKAFLVQMENAHQVVILLLLGCVSANKQNISME